MREEVFLFGKERSLVGVLTDPTEPKGRSLFPAFIILNSGIIHRVGPNRLHVKLARNLASSGFVVMRFDFSGIGDSKAREDKLPFFKSAVSETQEAMSYLEATRGIKRFILVGICSGAAILFRTACQDPRVIGIVPINNRSYMYGFDEETGARLRRRALARHYLRIALSSSFRGKNWLKAMTGKVNYRGLIGVMFNCFRGRFALNERKDFFPVSQFTTDLRSLTARGVRVLLVHCEGDEGLDYLRMILGNEGQERSVSGLFRLEIIRGANHTFTPLWSQEALLTLIEDWTREMAQEGWRRP